MKILIELVGGRFDGNRYALAMENPPQYWRMPIEPLSAFLERDIHITATEYELYELKLDENYLPTRKDDGTYTLEYKGLR